LRPQYTWLQAKRRQTPVQVQQRHQEQVDAQYQKILNGQWLSGGFFQVYQFFLHQLFAVLVFEQEHRLNLCPIHQ